jgi:predicted  nucleic acid-binding Zn-ribbon protein
MNTLKQTILKTKIQKLENHVERLEESISEKKPNSKKYETLKLLMNGCKSSINRYETEIQKLKKQTTFKRK